MLHLWYHPELRSYTSFFSVFRSIFLSSAGWTLLLKKSLDWQVFGFGFCRRVSLELPFLYVRHLRAPELHDESLQRCCHSLLILDTAEFTGICGHVSCIGRFDPDSEFSAASSAESSPMPVHSMVAPQQPVTQRSAPPQYSVPQVQSMSIVQSMQRVSSRCRVSCILCKTGVAPGLRKPFLLQVDRVSKHVSRVRQRKHKRKHNDTTWDFILRFSEPLI